MIKLLYFPFDTDPFFCFFFLLQYLYKTCFLQHKCGQNVDHLGIIDLNIEKDSVTGMVSVEHSFMLKSSGNVEPFRPMMFILEKWKASSKYHKVDGMYRSIYMAVLYMS